MVKSKVMGYGWIMIYIYIYNYIYTHRYATKSPVTCLQPCFNALALWPMAVAARFHHGQFQLHGHGLQWWLREAVVLRWRGDGMVGWWAGGDRLKENTNTQIGWWTLSWSLKILWMLILFMFNYALWPRNPVVGCLHSRHRGLTKVMNIQAVRLYIQNIT